MITKTYEPIRPIYADDNGCAFAMRSIIGGAWRVFYGWSSWPTMSYWQVPRCGAWDAE